MKDGRSRRGAYLRAVLGLALVPAVLGGVWLLRRPTKPPGDGRLSRLVAASAFRNVEPGVGYVGDASCARCHPAIAESYRTHPMGRSVTTALAATGTGPNAATPQATFDAEGYHYAVERRDDRVVHREQRLDEKGQPVAEVEAEVGHAIGSGELGFTFTVERAGLMFLSPITWYGQATKHYDLAPGYHGRNIHFERVALPDCLACHVDGAHPAKGALNRYETPIDLRPIGCERCHGPGELHASNPGLGREGFDPSIVNPRRLAPTLRDSVCEQCHLQGDHRVPRYGRDESDFRPGLPLDEFIAIYFESDKLDRAKAVGQVEQMRASRCFEASDGALGCISCHDPHRRPTPAERVGHYRACCLTCHDTHGCSLPEPDRRAREPEDSCIACHMPRQGTADVAHVSMSDHRIPRAPGAVSSSASPEARLAGTGPLVRFGAGRADAPTGVEADRDLGVALFGNARRHWRPDASPVGPRRALALIDKALAVHPDDVAALEGKAHLLWMQDRTGEARDVLQAALRVAPDHERLLETTASLDQTMGRRDEAISLMRRAVALNPYCADYHRRLALWHAEAGDWPEAARSARAALALDMSLLDARLTLVEALLRTGDRASAQEELRRLLAFNPPNAEAIRRRFAGVR